MQWRYCKVNQSCALLAVSMCHMPAGSLPSSYDVGAHKPQYATVERSCILEMLLEPIKSVTADCQFWCYWRCAISQVFIIKAKRSRGHWTGGTKGCNVLFELLRFSHIVNQHCKLVGSVEDVCQVLLRWRQGLPCKTSKNSGSCSL